jgi:putative ABC transport system ATP-binding protein
MNACIHIEDLCKEYIRGENKISVLEDLSLEIQGGEFVALMGPSGSGKTTLLNIIAGIDDPTSGTVLVNDLDVHAMSEADRTAWRTRNVGYIFQFYNLLPVLTAYENIELPLLLLPLSKTERREHVEAAMEATGITERAAHYPRELSGGQEQRVAIARAIVTDARILVADEPTGNLDAESEQDIMDLLQRLNKEFDKTMIMVTHDASAASFADRALSLEKGRLLAVEKGVV